MTAQILRSRWTEGTSLRLFIDPRLGAFRVGLYVQDACLSHFLQRRKHGAQKVFAAEEIPGTAKETDSQSTSHGETRV